MPWTTPMTWTPGIVPGATEMNAQVRDNFNHLLARPVALAEPQAGTDYTVTSTSYVDLDAGSLNLALTPASGRVLIGLNMVAVGSATLSAGLRVNVDAGLQYVYWSENLAVTVSLNMLPTPPILLTGLAAGAQHTFKLQVKVSGYTLTIKRTGDAWRLRFWVMEV